MDSNLRVERTRFYTNDGKMEPSSLLTNFKSLDFIPSHGHGYILGILKEPVLTSPTISFTFNLCFSFDKQTSEQLHVGTKEVAYTDILNSSLAAFHMDREVPDLLAVFATGLRSAIKILKFNEHVQSYMAAILSNLKFNKISDIYYVMDNCKMVSFQGVLLQIMPQEDSCVTTFYTRNFEDLCLYMLPFKKVPSDLITVKNVNVNTRTIFLSLFNEIKYFNHHVKSFLSMKEMSMYTSDAAIIPLKVFAINKLINLEECTEYNFSLLKLCG